MPQHVNKPSDSVVIIVKFPCCKKNSCVIELLATTTVKGRIIGNNYLFSKATHGQAKQKDAIPSSREDPDQRRARTQISGRYNNLTNLLNTPALIVFA